MQRDAVEAQLEALHFVERRNLVEAGAGISCQLNAHVIDTVAGERVVQRRTAARAERKILETVVLAQLGGEQKMCPSSAGFGDAPTAVDEIFCAAAM